MYPVYILYATIDLGCRWYSQGARDGHDDDDSDDEEEEDDQGGLIQRTSGRHVYPATRAPGNSTARI